MHELEENKAGDEALAELNSDGSLSAIKSFCKALVMEESEITFTQGQFKAITLLHPALLAELMLINDGVAQAEYDQIQEGFLMEDDDNFNWWFTFFHQTDIINEDKKMEPNVPFIDDVVSSSHYLSHLHSFDT
jgi:hypothetical protein